MSPDFEWLKQGLGALAAVLNLLKQAKDLLPHENTKKQEITGAIENAERQLKIAESQIAQSMGYVICKAHFPPGIMTLSDGQSWKCKDCGFTKPSQRELKSPWSSLGNK